MPDIQPFLRASARVQGIWTVYIRPTILTSCVRRGWCGAVWLSLDSNLLPGKPWTRVQLAWRRKGRLPAPPATEPGHRGSYHPEPLRWLVCSQCPFIQRQPLWPREDTDLDCGQESRSRTQVWTDAHTPLASYAGHVFYHIRISYIHAWSLICKHERVHSVDAVPHWGLPGGASSKEPTCQCRKQKRRGFDPWVGKVPWRRAWQPTPVFLPGESHGQRSLAGYSPWGREESERTEAT